MSMDVNEKDWKLFRKNLPDWQENYMEKLIKEYVDFLKGDGYASGITCKMRGYLYG